MESTTWISLNCPSPPRGERPPVQGGQEHFQGHRAITGYLQRPQLRLERGLAHREVNGNRIAGGELGINPMIHQHRYAGIAGHRSGMGRSAHRPQPQHHGGGAGRDGPKPPPHTPRPKRGRAGSRPPVGNLPAATVLQRSGSISPYRPSARR